jgi:hypothetical protein
MNNHELQNINLETEKDIEELRKAAVYWREKAGSLSDELLKLKSIDLTEETKESLKSRFGKNMP